MKPAPPPGPSVTLLGRTVPVVTTASGVRAIAKAHPGNPDAVQRYLAERFGSALSEVEAAMRTLAKAYPPKRLDSVGFALYEQFRPEIPNGVRGWGAKGRLNLQAIREMAHDA